MRRRLTVATCLALGCAGNLDTPDSVHDLRLLAIRAEPPAEALPVELLQDGGVVTLPGDGGLPVIQPIVLTGLVADPDGGGRAVTYQFATCAALDTSNDQCDDSAPGYQVLGSGTVVPGDLGAEPSFTWTPDYAALSLAIQNDPLQGFGGLQVPVQLQISAGDTTVVGIKRVVFDVGPEAALPPNQNPGLSDLQLDGVSWPDGSVESFTGTVDGKGKLGGGNDLNPIPDPSLVETYFQPSLQGGGQTLTEQWRYFFYTTGGSFSPTSTGGGSLFTSDAGVDSTWKATADLDGPAFVWVVITDGRGGETWVSREAVMTIVPVP